MKLFTTVLPIKRSRFERWVTCCEYDIWFLHCSVCYIQLERFSNFIMHSEGCHSIENKVNKCGLIVIDVYSMGFVNNHNITYFRLCFNIIFYFVLSILNRIFQHLSLVHHLYNKCHFFYFAFIFTFNLNDWLTIKEYIWIPKNIILLQIWYILYYYGELE